MSQVLAAIVLATVAVQLVLLSDTIVEAKKSKPGERRRGLANVSFSHYVLAINTHGGFCNATASCDRKKGSLLPWTIHGLWPSNNRTKDSPTSCPLSTRLDMAKLEPLLERLNRFWPTLLVGNNSRFWRHEWAKHGTCSVNHTRIQEPVDYFNTTLNLFSAHNITRYLENDNIYPGLTAYKTADFFKAVSNDISDKNVNVICRKSHNISVVVEVRLCLNETSLDVVDCPWRGSNCKKSLYYLPPTSTSSGERNLTTDGSAAEKKTN